jgi:uncharacterized protein YrrD
MKSIHDLLDMPLVTVREGIGLGKLQGVAVDTAEGRIRYLCFDGAETRSDGVLPWEAVRTVGKDAITIDSLESVQETLPAADRDRVSLHLGDRPVVSEGGNRLGKVVGYDIDELTGQVETYHISTGGFFGRLVNSERTFTRAQVLTLGEDAIIVAGEAEAS